MFENYSFFIFLCNLVLKSRALGGFLQFRA